MSPGNQVRALAVFAAILAAGYPSRAQSTLPPTAPSALAASTTPADTQPPAAPVHRAQVSYQLGQLTVIAENSSLEEILRDIAANTGMKITGGVVDQQVYGTYGPAPASVVLRRLLDGSGSNMILRETAKNEPAELVLTPMQGTPTPPNLSTGPSVNLPPSPAQVSPYSPSTSQYPGAPAQPPRPVYQPPQYQTVPPPLPAAQQTQPASTDQSTPRSPNGVLTPQQIYEQLQRLQQQQPQPPSGSR